MQKNTSPFELNLFKLLQNLQINNFNIINKWYLILFIALFSNIGYSQLATEFFEGGIPGSWAVKSNLLTPPINNNWVPTTATGGYLSTKGASVNPALNNTIGTQAEYYMITPQFLTPSNGEIRFYTKQGSVVNKGTTYQVRISTASQPDISGFNVTLATWTESSLFTGSATAYEEKIVSTSTIPAGIPVYIAFVAITNQTGSSGTIGDSWFVDNVRAIPGCTPVTGITSIPSSDGAVINWSHPFATEFGIDVVPSGAGHGTTGTTVTSATYTASGLISNTPYDVYIQVHCDPTTLSTWAGPFHFTTAAVGFSCAAPIIIPPSAVTSSYTLATNLNTFYDNVSYVSYTTQGSSCLPSSTPSTWNYLSGDHAFLSFTPATSGLINLTQTVSTTSGGGCYGNTNSAVLIYDSCTNVGTPAGCIGSVVTNSSPSIPSATLYNFYVQAGHTYIIVISSPYQHSNTSIGASICFTFTLSGSVCSAPAVTAMSYKHLLSTSGVFSWDNAQNLVSSWQYVAIPLPGTGIAVPPNGSETLLTTNSNIDNSITGLLPGTNYNLYVRSVCGGTPGPWSMPFPFTTQCTVFPTPYSTAFTNASTTAPEPCWTSMDLNNDSYKFIYSNDSSPGAPQGQIARLYTSNSGNNTNDMLVTPMVHFDGVTQKRLRFKFKGFGGYTNSTGYVLGKSSYTIKVSTTGIGEQDFITTIDPLQTYETGNNWVERIIPIPISVVGDVNISWHLPLGSLQTATNLTIDDVFIEDLPACSSPMYPSITPGSITSTSAELTWTNGYNTSQWEIIAQPMGSVIPSASASGTIVSTNPYTFTGLTPSTQYDFWIRSYCDTTHQSQWIGPISFFTTCIAQPVPYYESFNDGDITSKKFCWTIQNRNSDTAKWMLNSTEAEITPQNIDYFTPLANFNDWLVSVPLNIVGQKRLRFKYKAATDLFYPTPRADMQVVISSTPDFATYTVLIPEHEFINNNYMEDSVLFTGTGISYIAFVIPSTMVNPANSAHVMIDDVYIENPPGCEVPSNLAASGMTTTTANLNWAIGYTETQWEIKVQSPMSGIPTGSGTLVNTNPTYTATGLTVDTPYEYYVRAVCDATHLSQWVGPFPFRTICNPLPTPFTESFDSSSTTETCWTVLNNNGDSHFWNLNETGNSPLGDQMAAFMSGTNGANNDWLITPTLIAHPNQRLRFKYKTYSSNFEEDLKVMLSTNGVATNQFSTVLYENNILTTTDANGTTIGSNVITLASAQDVRVGDVIYIPNWPFDYGTTVTAINGLTITLSANATATFTGTQNITFTHETIDNPVFKEKVINLPPGLTGNINIGFYVPFFPPNPWNYRGQFLFIDNVIIEDIPVCSAVSNVTTQNIIDTAVDVDWTVNGTETSWEISVQPFGTPAPVGATLPAYLVTSTTHPKTITGLIPSSHYQYYIRSICSGSSQSEWVGPFDFTTKCDYSNVCQYTISLSNGSTGHVYQGLEIRQNGAMVQMLTFPQVGTNQPTVLDYQVYLCRGVEFNLYYNAGGGSGAQYTQAQAIVKDENNNIVWTSPLGLGTPYTNIYTGVSSCGTITCAQPTNLVVSNQGVLSWTAGATETQWEVFIQPNGSGTIPQSGVIVNSTTYTPVASDFINATAGTYEFLVRAICGPNNKSFWSGPRTFIRNDESNTAIHLPVNSGSMCDVSGIDASFNGATVSTNPTNCSGGNLGDIWYDFVATSKVHVIELSDFGPGSYYTSSYQGMWPQIMLGLYEVQPDGTLVQIACSNNNSLVTSYSSELVVGHTYKIRITLNNTLIVGKLFHVCITTPSDACNMNAFNYDFEKLPMQGVTGVSSIIDARVIPGWRVNTDWGTMFFQEGSNSPGIIPYSGGQCLQLTQDNSSTWNPLDINVKGLYKDFDTSEITQMDYSFASASRTNNSTVQLYAGPPAGPFILVTENTSNSLVWQFIQGNYIVPSGQTTTRFIFRVKNYTIGHLLDAANFKAHVDINTANTTLTCATTSINVSAEGIGQWLADSSNPTNVVIATPNVKTTTISGFNTPGVYIFHWKTRYCDKTISVTYQGIGELPTVVSPVNYCKDAIANTLTASVSSIYTPHWYTVPVGGVGTTIAPTPSTSIVGNSQVYYVSASDGVCEGPRSTIVVQVNDLPTITGTLSACVGNTIQLTGSGTAATTAAWTSSNTSVATISSTGLVTGITSGTTIITYINDKGCRVDTTVTINALPTITGTLSACIGNTTQLTGSGIAATTPWTSSNTSVATVSATGLVTGVASGTTTITYTNSDGCQTTATVTINALPTITGTVSTCVGTTTQLTGNGTAATTNAWTSSNTSVATVSETGLVTGVTSGTATITYINSNGCQATTTVTISSQIVPTFNSLVACQNSTLAFPNQSLENITGTWSPSTINTAIIGLTTYTFTPNTAIPSQACAINGSLSVTINALPTITGTLNACIGNTTQLTGNGTAATTTPWTSLNTSVATVSATGLVTGVTSGTATITYTNSNGCQTTATVTINALPTITGTLSACVGNTTQLTGNGTAATTTPWTSSNTSVATVSATGLVTGVTSGTTTIAFTNSNGCQTTATVTINALPTITGTVSACVGNTTQLTGNGTAAITTPWSSSNTSVASVSATGLVTGVASGTATITYTNSNGCQTTATVTINALPTITGTLSACIGNTTQLTGNGTAATATPWTSSNTSVATVSATGLVTGVTLGTATITYTNSNGCQTTTLVTINTLPTITGTLSACVGNTTQLTGSGTAATTTPWTSSNTSVATVSATGLVTGVTSGTATINYTNSNGCQTTATVTINALPTISGTLSACVGNTTQLTGNGTAATTNAWTSSNTSVATVSATGLVTGVASGTATITYTNSNGCQTTATVTINALPTITGTLSACVGNTTQLNGNGTATTATPWTSSNTSVATVSATGLVTGVASGTATVTYTNNNGCQATTTITISSQIVPTFNSLVACQNSTLAFPNQSLENITGTWSPSTINTAIIGLTTYTFTPNTAIPSQVCAINGSLSVTINALPTITGTLSACVGNTSQLTGSGTAATTTPWTSLNTSVATVSTTGLVTGVTSGTATITYTNSDGCQTTATVTINALPIITGNLSTCVGTTTQLTGSGTVATTTPWTSSNTSVATVSTTGLVTGVASGTATITYANNNGCQASTTVTISSQIVPTFNSLVACQNSTLAFPNQSLENITGTWSPSTINTAIIGLTNYTFTPNTAIPSQACAINGSLSVTINALPTISGTLNACVGNTTQLTGNGTAATTTPWTSLNTSVATVSATGLVTGVTSGTATITYTNSNGCQTTATVTINALPTITGTLSACVGNTTQLTGNGTAATTTPWTSSNTSVATVSVTGLVTGVTSGIATITYTNSNGCQTTTSVTINALPTITGTLSACVGNTTQLTGNGTAATTTPWSSSNTSVATISVTGLVTGVASGTATITYTNSNGCQTTATVTINALPTITGTLSACIGNTTQLTGNGTAATATPWTSSNTSVATVSATGLVTGLTSGTTTITYTNSNGCQKTTLVTINALPTITGTLSACVGNTTQLTGSGTAATTTPWTSSNTSVATVSATGLVTGVTSGTATINYTNSNGCQTTATVTINALPTISGTLSACVGNTTQLTGNGTAATTNAWTSSNTSVATVSATGLVTGVTSGTVTITYTNSNGCQTTATVTINALPTITGTVSTCVGTTTQLTGNGTAATATPWTSSNTSVATVSATGLVTGITSGTTTITYVNSNGCAKTILVTINALATPNIIFSYAQSCINATTIPLPILTTNFVTGGVYSSTTLIVNPLTGAINLATATTGTHQITYTLAQNSANCIAAGVYTASIVLSAGVTPVTAFTYNSTYCANSVNGLPTTPSGFYSGGVFSSTNGLSINASTGEINFAQSTPGNYTITYTVQPNLSNCNIGGNSNFSITISNPLNYTLDVACNGQSLELQVTPVANSFNANSANYSWTNASNIPIGTNASVFSVEDYLNQNPTLSLPLTFNVSVQMNGCSYGTSITVANNPCKIIPRGISPNNDQVNDAFDLTGLGVTDLAIYNRYGSKVYTFKGNYTNQWTGLTDEGNDLPDGTYFYVIQKGNGSNVTGWVYINRQY